MRRETLPLKSAAPFGSQNPQESDITHRPDGCVPLGRVRHYSSDKPQLDQKWIDQTHKKQWKPPVLAMSDGTIALCQNILPRTITERRYLALT